MHQRQTLWDSLSQIFPDILKLNENVLIDTLLFGNPKVSDLVNSKILMTSTSYISSTMRFDGNLMRI